MQWFLLYSTKNHFYLYFQTINDGIPANDMSGQVLHLLTPIVIGVIFVAFIGTFLVYIVSVARRKRSLQGTYCPQKQEKKNPCYEMMQMDGIKIPPEERLIWAKCNTWFAKKKKIKSSHNTTTFLWRFFSRKHIYNGRKKILLNSFWCSQYSYKYTNGMIQMPCHILYFCV